MNKNTSTLQTDEKTDYAGSAELWANEKFLKSYNNDIVNKLSKASGHNFEVLEFGAGLGTLSLLWEAHTGTKPECLEIDSSLRAILTKRSFVCYENLDEIKKLYDIIYTSNVLEHIEDDVAALKKLHSKLKPNGQIAIYVPAFMCLYNQMDAAVGHYRRYEKSELIDKLKKADFKIEECNYADSIGFFAWLSVKLLSRDNGNNNNSGASLKVYDKFIFPFSKLLDRLGFRYLFGKNLVVLARKA
jgi:SAM-dependent methyltransferase